MIKAYIAITVTTPTTIKYSIFFSRPFLPSTLGAVREEDPSSLGFLCAEIASVVAADFSVEPRLGEQLARDGEHRHLSRGLVRHDDDAAARKSVHAGRPAKPESG